ncbi:MAG: hypothetical protein NZ602_01050 [Thermoguttaceae bacterium]|nr:hypothetical protein [Thermoguttaceae bacterium]MDW8036557.1 hypothetical protein [Thermoguttaceae bacterium]
MAKVELKSFRLSLQKSFGRLAGIVRPGRRPGLWDPHQGKQTDPIGHLQWQ